jgi:hypothetical protein
MKKYVEEEFTPEMDFEFAADNQVPLDDEEDDADPPFERFDAPPMCPNCGDHIALYSPPYPFGRRGRIQIVGLFIQTTHWICPHCLTDRAMLSRFDVWTQIIELRRAYRVGNFDHRVFLSRELTILESLGATESVNSEVQREVLQYMNAMAVDFAKTRSALDDFFLDDHFNPVHTYPHLFANKMIPPSTSDLSEPFMTDKDLFMKWNERRSEISLDFFISKIPVESVGPATAYWYRAKTIRDFLQRPT